MKILFVPRPPAAIREAAEKVAPAGHSLHFISEDAPDYEKHLSEADILIGVPRKQLDASFFAKASKLRLIQLLRRGVDKVDAESAKAKDLQLATIGDLTAPFVAEHALAMILSLGRALPYQSRLVREGRWLDAKPWQLPHGKVDQVPFSQCTGVRGKTLGLLGMGNIGKHVAVMARAMGMKVQATTHQPAGGNWEGVPFVDLSVLLPSSDFVSVHLTLTAETNGILSAERLAQMKKGAFLINTARGQLVDEAALVRALESGHLAGAALDTLCQEPPAADHPLLQRDDVLVTPHSGWLGQESWATVLGFGFENIERFLAGRALENREL